VMYAPMGLGGVLLMHRPLIAARTFGRVLPAYALAAGPALMLAAGLVLLIETSHQLMVKASEGPAMSALWIQYQADSPWAWLVIVALLVAGALLLRRVVAKVAEAFHSASQEAQRRLAP